MTKDYRNRHGLKKTSDCPVCPNCSYEEMENRFGEDFPYISAPAFRAFDSIGV